MRVNLSSFPSGWYFGATRPGINSGANLFNRQFHQRLKVDAYGVLPSPTAAI